MTDSFIALDKIYHTFNGIEDSHQRVRAILAQLSGTGFGPQETVTWGTSNPLATARLANRSYLKGKTSSCSWICDRIENQPKGIKFVFFELFYGMLD